VRICAYDSLINKDFTNLSFIYVITKKKKENLTATDKIVMKVGEITDLVLNKEEGSP